MSLPFPNFCIIILLLLSVGLQYILCLTTYSCLLSTGSPIILYIYIYIATKYSDINCFPENKRDAGITIV